MMDWLPNCILCIGMPDHPVSLSSIAECSQYILSSQILLHAFLQVLVAEKSDKRYSCWGQPEWGLFFTEEIQQKTE